MTIIGDVYTPAERARMQGCDVGGVRARGGGRAGARRVSGRARALVGGVLGQPADRGRQRSRCSRCFCTSRSSGGEHRIDYLGGALLIVGVGALMLALVQARSLGAGGDRGARRARGRALAWLVRARAARRRADAAVSAVAPAGCSRCAISAGFGASATYMAVSALAADLCPGRDGLQPRGRRVCRRRAVGQLDVRLDRRGTADDPHLVPADRRDRRRRAGRRRAVLLTAARPTADRGVAGRRRRS